MSTVAVISSVWQGHIPAYHRLIISRLLAGGHTVLSLAPIIREDVGHAAAGCFHAYFGQSPLSQLMAAEARQPHKRPWWRRALDRVGLSWVIKQTAWLEACRALRLWLQTSRALSLIERVAGTRAELVILVYPAAGYLARSLPSFAVDKIFQWPWTGIWNGPELLRAGTHRKAGGIFHAKKCRGVIVPDEWMRERLTGLDPALCVHVMPEVADLTPAELENSQVVDILRAAAGRRIVGLLGNITKRKGIITFLEMAALAQATAPDVFFVAAGDFSLNSCGDEYAHINAACNAATNNFRLFPRRLADGAEFNAHVSVCDVIFAAYHDFPFQSNLLTKAAAFAKPVVVSRGFVMESRTIEFGLGLAVPPGDAIAAREAVCALLGSPSPLKPRWADYLELNSVKRLDNMLTALIAGGVLD